MQKQTNNQASKFELNVLKANKEVCELLRKHAIKSCNEVWNVYRSIA